jgi:hypothetical protein
LHFSIKFIGRINWGKISFVDVNGVRARCPSFTVKLLSDLDRFVIERWFWNDELVIVDRSFGVGGENNDDVLFANESPTELCRLSVPKFCRQRRRPGEVCRSFVFENFGKRKNESSSAWRIP